MNGVVADEWSVLSAGVAAVLARCGVGDVRHVTTGTEAVAAAGGADIVVVGLVRDVPARVAVTRVREANPSVRIIALVESADRDTALGLIDAGADAVADRETSEQDLGEAAVRVARGERYVAPGLLAPPARDREAAEPGVELTPRERAVLELLATGRSNREIAAALYIGEATVKTHLHRVYEKLGVANRVQAAAAVRELGILDR